MQRPVTDSKSSHLHSSSTSVCWKCLAPPPPDPKPKNLPENFCGTCQSIQPPEPNASPFDLLGVPHRFQLDLHEVERQYLRLQRYLHPDYYQAKSKMEQVYAEARSSQVNRACQVLRSPTKRAQLLLRERGVEVGEGAGTFQSDPALLMDVLEKREALEATPSSDLVTLNRFKQDTLRELAAVYQRFSAAFDAGDLLVAQHAAIHMIYLEKLDNMISERLPL